MMKHMRFALVPSIVAPSATGTSSLAKPYTPTQKPYSNTTWSYLPSPSWLILFSAEVSVGRISLQQSAKDCCPELARLQLSAFLQMLQEINNVESSLLPFWTLSSNENTVSQIKEKLLMWFCWKNTIEICIAYHQQTIDTQHHVIDFSRSFMVQTPVGSLMLSQRRKQENMKKLNVTGQAESHHTFPSNFGPST